MPLPTESTLNAESVSGDVSVLEQLFQVICLVIGKLMNFTVINRNTAINSPADHTSKVRNRPALTQLTHRLIVIDTIKTDHFSTPQSGDNNDIPHKSY